MINYSKDILSQPLSKPEKERRYSIGQISRLVGLPTKTIRFYEVEKVISTPNRSDNGYRYYSYKEIEELRLLKYARDLGLPLVEIKKLMKGCEGGNCHHSREYIKDSISAYLLKLDTQLKQTKILQAKLKELKENVENNPCEPYQYCCDLLHQLIDLPRDQKGGE
jgi:MerR family copper efflux transcriptional regulator